VYTFAVSAILILLAFYSGAVSHVQNVERWEAAKAENLRQLDGITDWLRVRDHRVFLPPQPLASLVSGISNDIGRTTTVAPRGEVSTEDSRYNEEPLFAMFRFLDLEFIFQVVLSLFAILLGYDAISGEKERGTLKLCMANAVSRATFLLGKFIGSYAVLTISLLIPISVGCLLLPLLGVHLTGQEWLRLASIVFVGLLFFGAFLSLALFISSVTQRTANSFLLLLVIWVGSVMILPRAAVLLAGRSVEVPSVDEVGYQKASFATDLWKDFRESLAGFQAPKTEDPEEMMTYFNKYMDSLSTTRDQKLEEFRARVNENRYNRVQERAAIAFGLARVSPSVTLSLATAELAGTSPDLKQRYYDQAMAYQPILSDFLFEKTGFRVGAGMFIMKQGGEKEEPEPIDPTELPVFDFQQPSYTTMMAGVLPDVGLLALFNLLFFAGAVVAFNRYDAR
jgi:ABC-type transport system involved in multi-copper enzyme maturation permease subunit